MFRYCTFCMVWSMHPFAFVLEEDTKALKLQVLHIRRWHHQFDTKRWCLFVDQSMNWAHFFFSNANKGKMKHSSNPNAILMLSSDLSLWKVNLWISFPSYNTEEEKLKWIQYLLESQKYQFLWGVKLCSLLFSFVQHLGKRRKSEVKLAPLWCSKAASFFIWGQIVGLAAFFFYKKENKKQNQAHHHLLPCTYCTMYIYKFFWEWYLSKHPYVQRDTWHPAQMVLVIFLFPAL